MEVQPKYMLLGGVIGAGITWTVIKSIEALGPARSALLIVIAQLTVAYLIQLFGLFGMDREPFSWRKAGGLLLAVVGIAVFNGNKSNKSVIYMFFCKEKESCP